jgi:hypothetical protein
MYWDETRGETIYKVSGMIPKIVKRTEIFQDEIDHMTLELAKYGGLSVPEVSIGQRSKDDKKNM